MAAVHFASLMPMAPNGLEGLIFNDLAVVGTSKPWANIQKIG